MAGRPRKLNLATRRKIGQMLVRPLRDGTAGLGTETWVFRRGILQWSADLIAISPELEKHDAMSPTATTTLRIAIVGAEPVGLTLAAILHCRGVLYTVFERETSRNAHA
ncbi:hypothetical protein AAE478_004104 [Parahypoxylon ruwenzoriense]